MTHKFQFLIIFAVVIFGGLFFNHHQALAAPQPTCSGAPNGALPDFDWTTANTGTRATHAEGVTDATSVLFGAWSAVNGQDDVIWYSGADLGGGIWFVNIPYANHPGLGDIHVVVYMVNVTYPGGVYCDQADFTRLDTGTINVTSQDKFGNDMETDWTITCPLTTPACPSYTGNSQSSASYPNAPFSTWTIVPATIPGYDAVVTPSSSQSLE